MVYPFIILPTVREINKWINTAGFIMYFADVKSLKCPRLERSVLTITHSRWRLPHYYHNTIKSQTDLYVVTLYYTAGSLGIRLCVHSECSLRFHLMGPKHIFLWWRPNWHEINHKQESRERERGRGKGLHLPPSAAVNCRRCADVALQLISTMPLSNWNIPGPILSSRPFGSCFEIRGRGTLCKHILQYSWELLKVKGSTPMKLRNYELYC